VKLGDILAPVQVAGFDHASAVARDAIAAQKARYVRLLAEHGDPDVAALLLAQHINDQPHVDKGMVASALAVLIRDTHHRGGEYPS
jgi:hypothetical protein